MRFALSLLALTGMLASASDLAAVPAARVVRPGVSAPGTPSDLNASITVRYGAASPRAVLLLMPGFLGGASGFDRLARQLVTLDPTLAVWAVDRRANALEPQDVLVDATDADLRAIARDGLPSRAASDVSFVASWGLDVTLGDLRVAVTEARSLTPLVFLGGHSLGATLVAQYAAYDFGGAPGWRDVSGLLMLDGAPNLGDSRVTPEAYEAGVTSGFFRSPGLRDLPSDPFVTLNVLGTDFFGPTRAAKLAATARLAARAPNDVHPGGLVRFPATNLAAAMLQAEGRYALLPFASVTTGRAANVRESFNWLAVVLNGSAGFETRDAFALRDRARPADWQQDPAAPTNALDFVHRYWTPHADFTEWYFPRRLTLDVGAAGLDTRGTKFEQTLRVWHTADVPVPILGLVGGRGLASEAQLRAYASRTRATLEAYTLPGFSHLDVLAASSDGAARRVLDWMNRVAVRASRQPGAQVLSQRF